MKEQPGKDAYLPPVYERHQLHILNPAAGAGKHLMAAKHAVENTKGEMILSDKPGQITDLVREIFVREPCAHVVVYGGDGTVYEAVNGIMQSGNAATASFSVIPAGSGNDFSTHANDSGAIKKLEPTKIDLVRVRAGGEERWFANMMNIGFDCTVVWETNRLKTKPLLKGSGAYIAGVAKTLVKKKTTDAEITLEDCVDTEGNPVPDKTYQKSILLTACGNGSFCGGGFHALPLASLTDGYFDVLVVNDVSRRKFISLVGDYRKGTYLKENGEVREKFKGVVEFTRCRRMTIRGPERFCLDGEIFPLEGTLEAEVVHGATWFVGI